MCRCHAGRWQTREDARAWWLSCYPHSIPTHFRFLSCAWWLSCCSRLSKAAAVWSVCFISWWSCFRLTRVLSLSPLQLSGELLSCRWFNASEQRREGTGPLRHEVQEGDYGALRPGCFLRSRPLLCSWQCLTVSLWLLLLGADELRSSLL
jgi:hypothetical protein